MSTMYVKTTRRIFPFERYDSGHVYIDYFEGYIRRLATSKRQTSTHAIDCEYCYFVESKTYILKMFFEE